MNTTQTPNSSESPQEPHNVTPEGDVSWLTKHKNVLIGGGVALIIIVLIGIIVFLLLGRSDGSVKDEGRKQNNDGQARGDASKTPGFMQQYGDVCKKRAASLTASPIAVDQLGFIEPLGKVNDGHVTPTDHMYLAPKNTRAADNTTDVVMPGDGTVVEISAMPSQYIGDKQQQTASEDHRIVIAHSCQYFSIFIHIHKLSDALSAAAGNIQPSESKRVNVELKAGDLVGKIGGNPFDWTFLDTSKNLSGFISPELYAGESWKVHTIDQLAMYSGSLKTTLEAKSLRSKAPVGGKIDYDVKGALVGNWFREGTKGYSGIDQSRYWDGHLAIAPDYIDGTTGILSIGNWDDKAAQFAVKGVFDASKITKADDVVKIELIKRVYLQPSGLQWTGNETPVKGITLSQKESTMGTVLVQVLDGEKLKVEKFIGKTPAEVSEFTSAAQSYSR